jgi:hypothetical protein
VKGGLELLSKLLIIKINNQSLYNIALNKLLVLFANHKYIIIALISGPPISLDRVFQKTGSCVFQQYFLIHIQQDLEETLVEPWVLDYL